MMANVRIYVAFFCYHTIGQHILLSEVAKYVYNYVIVLSSILTVSHCI